MQLEANLSEQNNLVEDKDNLRLTHLSPEYNRQGPRIHQGALDLSFAAANRRNLRFGGRTQIEILLFSVSSSSNPDSV